jgi:hypothetical protein
MQGKIAILLLLQALRDCIETGCELYVAVALKAGAVERVCQTHTGRGKVLMH